MHALLEPEALPHRPTVYVVDPDETVRESVRELLRSLDCAVLTFPDARSFFEGPRPESADCLVMEIQLPDLGGLELLRRLTAQHLQSPIIVLAEHSDVPVAVEAIRSGVFDFIEKPFVERQLYRRVCDALGVEASEGSPSESA
jgi:two-component system response regulator DctR